MGDHVTWAEGGVMGDHVTSALQFFHLRSGASTMGPEYLSRGTKGLMQEPCGGGRL